MVNYMKDVWRFVALALMLLVSITIICSCARREESKGFRKDNERVTAGKLKKTKTAVFAMG
ncbi:MAG TPA: hypothetical protein VHO84_14250 [Syntrophorhabdaceae bacterium]|nr:hypothetical protein [Syntrophorhabdaceae bacterium]